MKQKILFSLIFLVIITSCTSNNNNDAKLEKDLYKGTQGVLLEYFENNFPNEVFENEKLDYAVKLTNKGPYQTLNGVILVSLEKGYMTFGNSPTSLENIKAVDVPSLEGKTIFNTFDDFDVIELPMYAKSLDALSEYHDTFILTTLCYDYKGIAIADVCIDPDPFDTSPREKECNVKESISLSEGQGGPVVIERIETRMITDINENSAQARPQFKIYVANRGQGTVLKEGVTRLVCNKDPLTIEAYNIVRISKIQFSQFTKNQFECIPEDLVLRNEQDFITCTLNTPVTESYAYQTPLTVEIAYGYTESSSKEIKIKKILPY